MGFDMNWTQSYAANKNAQKANQNAQNATNAALAAAMASQQSAQASNQLNETNLLIAQMVAGNKQAIDEMREWEKVRFNDMVDCMRQLNGEIQDLHRKLGELQAQLSNTTR